MICQYLDADIIDEVLLNSDEYFLSEFQISDLKGLDKFIPGLQPPVSLEQGLCQQRASRCLVRLPPRFQSEKLHHKIG